MKSFLLTLLISLTAMAGGKIQQQGIKTAADCTGAGASLANCLPLDSQIWVSSVTPAQQLSSAITAGLIGGGGGNTGKNYLANPGFEGGNSGWTISGATNAVNTSDFHDGVQSLTLTPTGAGSILQSATPAPNLFGSNLESGVWVKTTKTDVSVCALSAGSEVQCQAVPATGQWVYVPANQAGPTQGTTIGVKVKWGSTGGSIIVDQGYVGGATNLSMMTLQNTFSAKITTAGVVSRENTPWIASCTNANPVVCTFKTDVFKTVPNCVATTEDTINDAYQVISAISTSSISIQSGNFLESVANRTDRRDFTLVCTRSTDTQLAVNSLNADYGLTAWTPTFTTVSPSVVEMYHSRQGEFLYIQGKIVHAGGTGALTFTLPNGLVASSSKLTAASNYQVVGTGSMTSSTLGSITILAQAGLTTLAIGADGFAGGGNVPYTGAWGSETMTFFAKIPIQGWVETQKAPVLVGSVTSGASNAERVERFKFYQNAGNDAQTCNSSPCSLESSITGATMVRNAGGDYTLTWPSGTWSSKPFCVLSVAGAGVNWTTNGLITTTTSTTLSFLTGNVTAGALDAYGTIICMGPK